MAFSSPTEASPRTGRRCTGTCAGPAAPDRVVAGLMGDGGLGMSIGEFETAVRLGLRGLVFVVVDNQASGYVKALQHSLYADRFQSVDSVPVDYARVAREFGLHAERVDDPAQL